MYIYYTQIHFWKHHMVKCLGLLLGKVYVTAYVLKLNVTEIVFVS